MMYISTSVWNARPPTYDSSSDIICVYGLRCRADRSKFVWVMSLSRPAGGPQGKP